MLFSQGRCSRARAAISRIDEEFARLGVQAHRGKDVNESLNCILIGVDLQDGRRLAPTSDKLALVLVGLVYLLSNATATVTPLELQAILGHLAWFALLARPVLSCLHEVYGETRRLDTIKARLSGKRLIELTLFAAFLPFIDADLTRPWADVMVASDAFPSFGFGVSVAPATGNSQSFCPDCCAQGGFCETRQR